MIQKNSIIFKVKLKKKHGLLFLALLFISFYVQSQNVPNYTQYLYNMQIINPAYAGVRADLSVSLLSRQQWVGIPGAPHTNTLSINARTSRGMALGTTVVHDKIGLSETTNVNADVSYTLITSQYSRLSFGLKAGVNFFKNNLFDGITPDGDVYASTSGSYPNIGFGLFFYNRNFYAGFSMPTLLETPQFYIQDNFDKSSLATSPNYFFSSGYLFNLSEDIMFKPSTMIRYTANLPISVDINSNFLYKEVIEAGLSYRYQNSVSALFAIIVNKKFRIGYSYDYRTTNVGTNLSSHELILHLDLNFLRNTRWLPSNKCFF